MKVAFLTNSGILYGSNRSLLNLVEGLERFPVEPHVIVPDGRDMAMTLASRNIPFAVLPIQNWVSNCGQSRRSATQYFIQYLSMLGKKRVGALYRLVKNMAIMPRLIRQLRMWNIDVVYTNSSVTPVGAMAAMLIQRPHIWHLREFANSLDSGLCADWGMELHRQFIVKSDAQIAISRAIHSYYLGNANAERTSVIYNGIASLAQFDEWKKLGIQQPSFEPSKPYTFVIVGRISPYKGQSTAIEAIAILADRHPNIRLLVVGGGQRDTLEELAAKLGVADKIEYWGFVEDPYHAYFSSDAVLVCSKSEGMGRAAVEAMAACRPVIGLDRTATPEIVADGFTGLLFNDGAESLAECMRQFIENPSWARNLGMNGWRVAREKFNTELHAQQVYEVLNKVVHSQ